MLMYILGFKMDDQNPMSLLNLLAEVATNELNSEIFKPVPENEQPEDVSSKEVPNKEVCY